MSSEQLEIAGHLLGALVAGGIIGLERSYHARPAGFRTHALVCLASTLLMMITYYQWEWLPDVPVDTIRADPTRMAQGIMTGIGFLGAGVIFKEGLSVRGLTTAASIWITAAIGILIGIEFYLPAIMATVLTVGVLSIFRSIEAMLPSQSYIHHQISFDRHNVMPEQELNTFLQEQGFKVLNISYRVKGDSYFEYRMVIKTDDARNVSRLAELWGAHKNVREFRISPTGD